MMDKYPNWCRDDKSVIACTEKIKVMRENFDEISELMQEAFNDGIIMEVNDSQMRQILHSIVDDLENPYKV